jgi:hypothetical protein
MSTLAISKVVKGWTFFALISLWPFSLIAAAAIRSAIPNNEHCY